MIDPKTGKPTDWPFFLENGVLRKVPHCMFCQKKPVVVKVAGAKCAQFCSIDCLISWQIGTLDRWTWDAKLEKWVTCPATWEQWNKAIEKDLG